MLKYLLAGAVAFALIAAPVAPSFAQATTTEKTEKKAAKKPSAKQSAQQQKMKDCAAKWGDHKKEKKVSGRTEHRKFMSECLKA
jgi:psiF repeat-containing protein